MISADFASIEVDIEKQHIIVNTKQTLTQEVMGKIIKEVVKVTNKRALDVAADYTMKINYKNVEK